MFFQKIVAQNWVLMTKIYFTNLKVTLRGLKSTPEGLILTLIVPNSIPRDLSPKRLMATLIVPNSTSRGIKLDYQSQNLSPTGKNWTFKAPTFTLKGPLSAPRCLKINSQIRIYDTNRLNSTTTPEHKIISQRPIDSNNLSSKGKKMNFQRPYHFKRTTIDSMRSKNQLPNVHIVPKMNYQNTKSTSKGPKSTPVTRKQLQLVQNSQI